MRLEEMTIEQLKLYIATLEVYGTSAELYEAVELLCRRGNKCLKK